MGLGLVIFFTKNPNLKHNVFWGVGWGGGVMWGVGGGGVVWRW